MLREVTDRLGFLNYVLGSLSGTVAGRLDTARAPLKALRDNEVTLTQRRNVRAGLKNQIGRLEHGQEKGVEKRIAELKEQLAKAEKDDEPLEKEHEILLRKALKESEQLKFQALREVRRFIRARSNGLSSVNLSSLVRRKAFPSFAGCRIPLCYFTICSPVTRTALYWQRGNRIHPCFSAALTGSVETRPS